MAYNYFSGEQSITGSMTGSFDGRFDGTGSFSGSHSGSAEQLTELQSTAYAIYILSQRVFS